MRVELTRSAEREAFAASVYYGERGQEFDPVLLHRLDELSAFPELGAPLPGTAYRRLRLLAFPFSLYYEVMADRIVVYALGHDRRRPGYWKRPRPRRRKEP